MGKRVLSAVLLTALAISCAAQGPERNCNYNEGSTNYIDFFDAHTIGAQLFYGADTVTVQIVNYCLGEAVFTERPTENNICAFTYENYNGWNAEFLDAEHCGMTITKTFPAQDYYDHCASSVTNTDFGCPGCAQYKTVIQMTTDPMYTGTLPDGTKEYVTEITTSTSSLLVPTEATGSTSIIINGPQDSTVLMNATFGVIPGTTTLGISFVGEINWPYGIQQMITPPGITPVEQVLTATVVPETNVATIHSWTMWTGLVAIVPSTPCYFDGTIELQFVLKCLDTSQCDASLSETIDAKIEAAIDGCPDNMQQGEYILSLVSQDPATGKPISYIEAGKPVDLVTTITPIGIPAPIDTIECTYDVESTDYDGVITGIYTDVGHNSDWNPKQLPVDDPHTENTLEITIPLSVVPPNGDVFIVSVDCSLPQPKTRSLAPNSASSVNALSLTPKQEGGGLSAGAIAGICIAGVVVIAVPAVIIGVVVVRSKRGYKQVI